VAADPMLLLLEALRAGRKAARDHYNRSSHRDSSVGVALVLEEVLGAMAETLEEGLDVREQDVGLDVREPELEPEPDLETERRRILGRASRPRR